MRASRIHVVIGTWRSARIRSCIAASWRNASLAQRSTVMFKFRELLNERKGELAQIVSGRQGDAPHATLDEYELTQHYKRWEDDIALIAELGVTHARYGIPWHKINPQPNAWNWEFADKTLGRMLDSGIEPIVDLVHYGLPGWIEPAWLSADFPT